MISFRNIVINLLLTLSIFLSVDAQTLKVERIELSNFDISAQALSRVDANGEECALLRMQLPVEGVLFEGSIVGDVSFKTNHYLIYMPYTSKRVKVLCPGFHSIMIEFSEFGTKLESGNTYDIYCELRSNQTDEDGEGMNKTAMPIAFKTETGWGFKDINDNVIVPPIYRDVIDFRDGIAWVKNEKSLWGSINVEGNIIIENKYEAIRIIGPEDYAKNICIAGWKSDDKGDYAEIIDYKTGKLLHTDKFKCVMSYKNEDFSFFCCTNRKDREICIDKKSGTEKFKFPKGKSFAGYYAPSYIGIYDGILKEGEWPKPKYGIIDLTGREIIKSNNYRIKKLEGIFDHIVIIHPSKYSSYEESAFLYDLKLRRQIGGTYYNFYEHKGNWDCPLIVTCLYNGYGNAYYGVLNLVTGQEIIPAANRRYKDLIILPHTLSDPIVAKHEEKDNTYFLISHDGNERKKIESDSYLFFKNGFSRFGKDGKLGFINANGDVIINPEYDKVEEFKYNEAGVLRCKAIKDGKTYFFDTNGNIL
ncbi:MAG: WG repeat-containing protein [Muribaculum sp.]|nr:WG repeat-containing protein [Muribaculum sp.]